MKTQLNLSKAVISGIVGTIVMTLFTYMGAVMNIKMDIPAMLASMFGGVIIIGWIMHFMIGIVLALSYSIIFFNNVNIYPLWIRGALFGIIPWLMAQIFVMPMMSMMNGMGFTSGFFSGSLMMSMASLVGHLIYGAVVGVIYKPQAKLASA